MKITIYHNPECGTSRNVVHFAKEIGLDLEIVEYLNTGWQREQLVNLLKKAKMLPKEALRVSKSPAEELGLTKEGVTDDEILEAMLKFPILVNRPIVETHQSAMLCRPSEKLFEFLEIKPKANMTKEDGSAVSL